MNNEIEHKLQLLKDEFYELDEIKEFLHLKNQIENNKYLNELKKELFNLQKDISLSMDDEIKHSNLVKTYSLKLEEYNSHPLIKMYNNLYKNVESLILNIKDILEK